MVEEDFIECPDCGSPAQKTTDPDTEEVRISCPDCKFESLNGVEAVDDFISDYSGGYDYDEDDEFCPNGDDFDDDDDDDFWID